MKYHLNRAITTEFISVVDKNCVSVSRNSTPNTGGYRHDRRRSKRLLCSDLVQLAWKTADGVPYREIAILENLSLSGVGLFMGLYIPEGTEVRIIADDAHLRGCVKQCRFRENGYIVGLELHPESQWAQQPNSNFWPKHLLDVSLLEPE